MPRVSPDLTGQVFHRLTAMHRDMEASQRTRQAMWVCRCACGEYATVAASALLHETTKSCGCYRREFRTEDLTGRVFTRLTVVERGEDHITPAGDHRPKWVCRCTCGEVVSVQADALIQEQTLSCGCLGRERRAAAAAVLTHDYSTKVFGELAVLVRGDDYVTPGGWREITWICYCRACERFCVVFGSNLKREPKSCGCLKRVDEPTYDGAHARTVRERGPASDYTCIDGDHAAEEWTYNHLDPDELTEIDKRSGKPRVYSANPAFYDPRCRSHHKRFDNAYAVA